MSLTNFQHKKSNAFSIWQITFKLCAKMQLYVFFL